MSNRSRAARVLRELRDALPQGRTLPPEAWLRRHRAIVALLWSQVVATAVLALVLDGGALHVLEEEVPLVAFAALASSSHLSRRVRSCLASGGLLAASVLVVHSTDGLTEGHFYFFVIVVVLALYEDWLPFLLALGVVVLHHGIVGVLAPEQVYSSPSAIAHPVQYAFIHGGFVAAAGIAAVVGWRLNEQVRGAAVRAHERFRRSFHDAPIGMVLAAPDGTWLEVNRALCRTLGRDAGELVALGLDGVVDPADRTAAHERLDRLRAGDAPVDGFDLRARHRDGRTIFVSVSASALEDDSLVLQLQDVSARRQAEADGRRRLAQQEHVAALGRMALERVPLSALLREAMCRLSAGLEVSHVDVLGDAGGVATAEPGTAAEGLRLPTAARDALLAAVADRDGPVVIEDAERDERVDAAALAEAGLRAGIVVPIHRAHGAAYGALAAFGAAPRRFTPEDVYFAQALAGAIGEAVRQHDADEDLRHQSLHDALTGLPNRVLFDDRLRHALARAQRTGNPVAVMFVDLDDFKLVNDGFGHQAGDTLLQTIATRIAACLRPNDTLARFGGDEFVILCEDLGSPDVAVVVAERIRASFDAPCDVGDQQHFVSASVGVATSTPAYYGRAEHLVRDADAAMYRAKAEGRNRVETFDDTMRERVLRRVGIEQELRLAIDRDELRLAYQPLIDLDDEQVTKCEALLRWTHPVHGPISPGEFVPIAEQSGLILRLGAWVLDEVCRQLATWRDSDLPELREMRVAVNLSAVQIAHDGLVGQVDDALRRHGIPAERLVCEITETALISDPASASRTLGALRELGIAVALDDFGTGYSSLASLKQYPLSTIKLDRSFICEMAPGNRDEAIVASVLDMARTLSLTTVAEGIETAAQRDALRELGCDVGQGFLFSRPLPADAFEAALRATPARR